MGYIGKTPSVSDIGDPAVEMGGRSNIGKRPAQTHFAYIGRNATTGLEEAVEPGPRYTHGLSHHLGAERGHCQIILDEYLCLEKQRMIDELRGVRLVNAGCIHRESCQIDKSLRGRWRICQLQIP